MKVLIVGVGNQAKAYAQVLSAMNIEFEAVGIAEENCSAFSQEFGVKTYAGGIESFVNEVHRDYDLAISAVSVTQLFHSSKQLVLYGIKRILLEKPGALDLHEFEELEGLAKQKHVQVFIAYNRRFYSSTKAVKKFIEEDGGASSFTFDFTEWIHKIEPLQKAAKEKENWFLANSTHVVDLAFFICGFPKQLNSYSFSPLSWHSASIFTGSGISQSNIPFSYHSNWQSAGRWGVEICTPKGKYTLCPLEEVRFTKRGTVQEEVLDISRFGEHWDQEFKPGLYQQVEAFIKANDEFLCSISEQLLHLRSTYLPILQGNNF